MKPETLAAAEAHAIQEYPRESCGVVVAVKRKEFYRPCRNIAENAEDDFVMHPDDLFAAEDEGEVTCIVHSHPNYPARPTIHDMRGCEDSRKPWLILAVHGDPSQPETAPAVTDSCLFEPSGYEMPYRGREFKFGLTDCYTMVRDFYQREMGVLLPDFERKDKFWERGEDLYMDNFTACGFTEIGAPSQKGDLILMAIRSDIVNHAGIWMGEGNAMLHHPYEKLSEITGYVGYWPENTRLFIRRTQE